MDWELYHGTELSKKASILKNGFTMPGNTKWPGDLGRGVYTFLDNDKYEQSAENAAKMYAKKYRRYSENCIIKIEIPDVDESRVWNLNDQEELDKLVEAKKALREVIDKRVAQLEKDNVGTSVANRHNIDGILLDVYWEYADLSSLADYLVKDRWEDIESYETNSHGGQIPNSTVVVIKNSGVIKTTQLNEIMIS
ncbi:hypothetical protein H9L19_06880 [Weissella diestrammenae]|uniref:DUF3990 domain-containing protein n=1 Tax=Weissella diestrammenae TaxID=1162633 RepID=A0A7G9T4R7_9LACO|nr:hypothetical protein [Weissella diestrammenae]MCM0582803.1 hypothetical protein [Weissella diestrammenae]QNN75092.1 hypothetical protein H9L19_06880 [Weissella diestrammenae]